MKRWSLIILPVLLALSGLGPLQAQHKHINAGAISKTPGSKLYFANGPSFNAESGVLIRLNPTNDPAYGPIYKGGNDVTFSSLPATLDFGGPDSHAALPGTHIEVVLVSLEGPSGGVFSFWDSFDGFFDATEITFNVPTGTTNGTSRFSLSENDRSPDSDPYGHIHGRKFSVNKPGLYKAGFRLQDAARNRPDGSPNHAPSELTFFYFQAGTTIAELRIEANESIVLFGTENGRFYFLETSPKTGDGSIWSKAAGPITGTGKLERSILPLPANPTQFYRLKVE